MTQDQPFPPITTEHARIIGDMHGKNEVIILCIGEDPLNLQVVTWGKEPEHKLSAANRAMYCVMALGGTVTDKTEIDDYRFVDEGKRAQIVDQLVRCCRAADHAIASVMACREGITDEALQNVRDALQKAIEAA